MNYLAHLALSGDNSEVITGNLMGDFLTRKELLNKSIEFKAGYDLHMFIDQFTDAHFLVDEVIALFRYNHGKYASVISDIIFDYFLAINWNEFYTIDFETFETQMYQKLFQHSNLLPDKVNNHLQRMIQGNFIKSYTSLYGLRFVLERMDRRSSFPGKFTEAIGTIEENQDFINQRFLMFYKELKLESEQKLINLQNGKKL